jgi:hypothetical protein
MASHAPQNVGNYYTINWITILDGATTADWDSQVSTIQVTNVSLNLSPNLGAHLVDHTTPDPDIGLITAKLPFNCVLVKVAVFGEADDTDDELRINVLRGAYVGGNTADEALGAAASVIANSITGAETSAVNYIRLGGTGSVADSGMTTAQPAVGRLTGTTTYIQTGFTQRTTNITTGAKAGTDEFIFNAGDRCYVTAVSGGAGEIFHKVWVATTFAAID